MQLADDRVAVLEAELRVRDERLARLEALALPMTVVPSYLHEEGHCISSLGASLDGLFTTLGRHGDAGDARQRVISAYEQLRALHDSMVGLLRRRPRANVPLVECMKQTIAELPPLAKHVRLDISSTAGHIRVPSELRMVMQNLIQNAADSYSRKGSSDVLIRGNVAEDRLVLQVADHGSGISATELPNIWQLGYTTKDRAGLGLTIVKRLVESWTGTVGIASTPSQGTTVTLSLPLHYDQHSVD